MSEADASRATHESLCRANGAVPDFVEVPSFRYLMIDGHGDPDSAASFAEAVQALYSAAYAIKFAIKAQGGPDERVAPLEGLWWGAEATNFAAASKDDWAWTLMIRIPDSASDEIVYRALTVAAGHKPALPFDRIRVEPFVEGLSAQVMYVGPYSEEGPTIAALHGFIAEHGYRCAGKHHEIYVGDPRRADPSRLKTVLRQPVEAAA